jgi:hypothetical protein
MDTTCPHCGEVIDTHPDLGGGEHQQYIEDCPICCRPIRFCVDYDADRATWNVETTAEI